MAGEPERDFPLFPLGIVALPGELVPLHIFEERYKTMINVCLREEREFGILWLSEEGLHDVGCACAIDSPIELMDDARMNLVARGTRPIRIVERQPELPYPAGVVEFLGDRAETVDEDLAQQAHSAFADLVRRATDRDPEDDELRSLSAYEMA